jgi:hypothetical protein
LAGEANADRERDREVRLAGARGPEQHDVLAGVQKVERREVLDHVLLIKRWKVKSNASGSCGRGSGRSGCGPRRRARPAHWPRWRADRETDADSLEGLQRTESEPWAEEVIRGRDGVRGASALPPASSAAPVASFHAELRRTHCPDLALGAVDRAGDGDPIKGRVNQIKTDNREHRLGLRPREAAGKRLAHPPAASPWSKWGASFVSLGGRPFGRPPRTLLQHHQHAVGLNP